MLSLSLSLSPSLSLSHTHTWGGQASYALKQLESPSMYAAKNKQRLTMLQASLRTPPLSSKLGTCKTVKATFWL